MNLKIIGVSGSPRHANTEVMVKHALEAAKSIETPEVSVETQFISLAQKNVRGCLNCRGCVRTGKCVLKDDWDELFRPLYDPMPDGVIFGASVYFYGINSQMRAYMERATSLLKANFFPEATAKAPDWSKCVGASIAVGYDRNGGQEHTLAALNDWFIINDFCVVGAKHIGYIGALGWGMGGKEPDCVKNDTEVGMKSAELIGKHVAELALLIKRGAQQK